MPTPQHRLLPAGDDYETTRKLLANLVLHPNAGGVLLVSLGCENNDLEHFLPALGSTTTAASAPWSPRTWRGTRSRRRWP